MSERRPSPSRSRHGMLFLPALLLTGAFVYPARADTIPVITLTSAGPDQPVPVGRAYYVSGTIDATVSDVQAVIVATGTTTIFGTTGPKCGAFLQGAPPVKPLSDIKKTTGATTAATVWSGPAKPPYDAGAPVFLPGQWQRSASETGSTQYKILVPPDYFFSSAGAYCLFVYTATHHKKTDGDTLKSALVNAARSAAGCAARSDPAACTVKAQKDVDAALAKVTGLTADGQKRLRDAANQQWSEVTNLVSSATTIDQMLTTWSQTAIGETKWFKGPLNLPGYRPVGTDPLARATLGLLVEHGAVFGSGKPVVYTARNGVPVESLRVLNDGDTIQVLPGDKQLDLKTSSLVIGGADVTLRDALEMLRGRIRVNGGTYDDVATVQSSLDRIFAQPLAGQTVSALDRAYVASVQQRIHALSATVEGLLLATRDARAITPEDIGTSAQVAKDAGNWLLPYLAPCNAADVSVTRVLWGRDPDCLCVAKAPKGAWPGYRQKWPAKGVACNPSDDQTDAQPPFAENPLAFLEGELGKYGAALDGVPALTAALTYTIDNVTTEQATTAPIPVQASYTQDQWVFSYVTPVTGAAFVLASQTFSVFYIAAQVHLVPNLVNEPMWTQRGDILRSFALELGMSTTGGSFGPDNRFSGWNGIPPTFFGFAIHPLPYTSASLGGVLLERRGSTVAQEAPQPWVGLYGALNVQANIPDLVVALKGRTTAPTN